MGVSLMRMERVRKVTLTEAVANRILEYIEEGILGPGDRLPTEKALVEMMGASRPIVREALQRLITLNVIETSPGMGATVKDFRSDTVINADVLALLLDRGNEFRLLWELREALEVKLAGLAALRASEEDLRNIERAVEAIGDGTAGGQFDAAVHMEVHYTIARAAHNPLFLQVIRPVFDLLTRYYSYHQDAGGAQTDWYTEHRKLYEAICTRDPEIAEKAMAEHLHLSFDTWTYEE